jgi:hypothetical protein
MIYICTVGTGTAGMASNVAEGIMAAIHYAKPDAIILVPSRSEESLAVAEIIQEGVQDVCRYIAIEPISDHDNLLHCRREIAKIIHRADNIIAPLPIVLNPTSGTKQMTTAAVLAGIDKELEHIEYITGPRQDGVIITGQEKIAKLSARKFIAEKHYRNAFELLKSGSYHAAAKLLEPYENIYPLTYAAAKMFYYWSRFDYNNALHWAKHGDNLDWKETRNALNILRNADDISLERIIDISNYAFSHCIEHGEGEEGLAIIYRLVELCAKLRLKELHVDCDNLELAAITGNPDLKLKDRTIRRLQSMAEYGNLQVGLKLSLELLDGTGFAFCKDFLHNRIFWPVLMERNKTRYGHGTKFIDVDDARAVFKQFSQSLESEWDIKELLNKLQYPILKFLIEGENNYDN